ncbi:MAG: YwiC-like family protein, partial [Firmicutes bacterium]|nr:YwiC-like family protein [Bacillota bacterium]
MSSRGANEFKHSASAGAAGNHKVPGWVWPREHGAWVMFSVAFVTGVAVGIAGPPTWAGPHVSGAPGTGAATMAASSLRPWLAPALLGIALYALFILREPLDQATRLKRRDTGPLWRQVAILAAVAIVAGGADVLLFRLWFLLLFSALAVLPAAVYLELRRRHLEHSATAELLGLAQLALAAPAAYLTAGGQSAVLAFWLWAALVAFYGGGVPYVKMKVRQAQTRPATWQGRLSLGVPSLVYQVAALALAALAWASGLLPGLAFWGFCPNAVKAVVGVCTVP